MHVHTYFLHNIIETKDSPNDSRIFEFLMNNPVDDGGQWNMLVNLVLYVLCSGFGTSWHSREQH